MSAGTSTGTGRLIGAAAAAGGLTWLFHARYWAHRDCIAEALSSCLVTYADGSQGNLTTGGLMWGVLAVPFWVLALALVLRARGARP
jgi:hypothetical protein